MNSSEEENFEFAYNLICQFLTKTNCLLIVVSLLNSFGTKESSTKKILGFAVDSHGQHIFHVSGL